MQQIRGEAGGYSVQANLHGTSVTLVNGQSTLYFAGGSGSYRLAGEFDASSNATGGHSLVTTVKATFSELSRYPWAESQATPASRRTTDRRPPPRGD